jgi:hypothetical protein
MGPLSDVLSLLKPRANASGGFDADGKWSDPRSLHESSKSR